MGVIYTRCLCHVNSAVYIFGAQPTLSFPFVEAGENGPVRVVKLAMGCVLMAGCTAQQGASDADVANANARMALQRVADLESEVSDLKKASAAQKRFIDAVYASLEEARKNHDSLRSTFNENVEKGNRRDAAQERDIDALMGRGGKRD